MSIQRPRFEAAVKVKWASEAYAISPGFALLDQGEKALLTIARPIAGGKAPKAHLCLLFPKAAPGATDACWAGQLGDGQLGLWLSRNGVEEGELPPLEPGVPQSYGRLRPRPRLLCESTHFPKQSAQFPPPFVREGITETGAI